MESIQQNRAQRKWTRQELAGRIAWTAVRPLFRFSPRICWGWRRFLLRLFHAKIGKNVHVHPTAQVFIPWNLTIGDWTSVGFDVLLYNLGPLRIGNRTTISQRAHLCGGTHDHRDPTMPLIKSPITIGDDVWVCADAFVGPGVTLGDRSIVAARAVVVKNVVDESIVGGNPATRLGTCASGIKK